MNELKLIGKTMSSLEIAELTGKRHHHVKRDIEKMFTSLEIDITKFGDVYINSQNQDVAIYNLNEDMTLTLVSGYNIKMRNIIIKRWRELEEKKQSLSLEDMTLLVIEGQKQKIMELELKIETDRLATDFGTAISQSAGTCKIGDWIKAINDSGDLKIGRNKAFKLLREKGFLTKDNKPMQSKVDQGLFDVKEGMVVTDKRTIIIFTTLLTGKGQMVLAAKFKEWLGGKK